MTVNCIQYVQCKNKVRLKWRQWLKVGLHITIDLRVINLVSSNNVSSTTKLKLLFLFLSKTCSHVVGKLAEAKGLICTASTGGTESEIRRIINKINEIWPQGLLLLFLLLAARQTDKWFHSALRSPSVSWWEMTFSWLRLSPLCCTNVWQFIPTMMCQTSLQPWYGGIFKTLLFAVS